MCVMDCDRILLAEKENVKALLRRATAYTNLGKEKMNNDTANFQKAHNDILTIEKIDNEFFCVNGVAFVYFAPYLSYEFVNVVGFGNVRWCS